MIQVVHRGSRIPDPDADFLPSRIPDPGVKKVPNPGSRIRIRNTGIECYVFTGTNKAVKFPTISSNLPHYE
jgi:hypothetical protein